jgi:hypothetical protein
MTVIVSYLTVPREEDDVPPGDFACAEEPPVRRNAMLDGLAARLRAQTLHEHWRAHSFSSSSIRSSTRSVPSLRGCRRPIASARTSGGDIRIPSSVRRASGLSSAS